MIGLLVLVALALPYILICLVPLIWISEWLRRRYVMASREIQRFDGISRSFVYALLSDTIKGLTTIRAYHSEHDFQEQFLEAVDVNGSWRTAFLLTVRWIGCRLDAINTTVLMVATYLSIFLVKQVMLMWSVFAYRPLGVTRGAGFGIDMCNNHDWIITSLGPSNCRTGEFDDVRRTHSGFHTLGTRVTQVQPMSPSVYDF